MLISDSTVNADSDISTIRFDRLALAPAEGGTYDNNLNVLFDAERIATWRSHFNMATSNTHSHLEVLPEAERIVFSNLGLSNQDYLAYARRTGQRRASLLLPDKSGLSMSAIDVVCESSD